MGLARSFHSINSFSLFLAGITFRSNPQQLSLHQPLRSQASHSHWKDSPRYSTILLPQYHLPQHQKGQTKMFSFAKIIGLLAALTFLPVALGGKPAACAPFTYHHADKTLAANVANVQSVARKS